MLRYVRSSPFSLNYELQIAYQNVTFVLLKNGSPVALLGPGGEKVCLGRDLAEAIAGIELPREEVKAWRRDLSKARKSIKAPSDRWK